VALAQRDLASLRRHRHGLREVEVLQHVEKVGAFAMRWRQVDQFEPRDFRLEQRGVESDPGHLPVAANNDGHAANRINSTQRFQLASSIASTISRWMWIASDGSARKRRSRTFAWLSKSSAERWIAAARRLSKPFSPRGTGASGQPAKTFSRRACIQPVRC